jgi:hypothetical protein
MAATVTAQCCVQYHFPIPAHRARENRRSSDQPSRSASTLEHHARVAHRIPSRGLTNQGGIKTVGRRQAALPVERHSSWPDRIIVAPQTVLVERLGLV